ncbi:MAG: 50S ribosomal protein L18 [Bryobacterales bacterium]|nr:50S ribosomal protein L18 [Bryobacterales bacterium]MBV9397343.1 50S ribosomal protein L18 [Bryobacterales bacterium]
MARESKDTIRQRIHSRIRRRVQGTPQRPRLAVFRSLNHIYAQVIDDEKGHTVVAASSNEKDGANGGNVAGAKAIGKLLAQRAQDKGIKVVVFDRGGYLYHGRVKALADAAREAGLEF